MCRFNVQYSQTGSTPRPANRMPDMNANKPNPLEPAVFEVLYIGTFGKLDHYAVWCTRENGERFQVGDTASADRHKVNRTARNLAQYHGVRWYGHEGQERDLPENVRPL